MRLILVRHGETVDNVAGVYAGSRDSPLTSHGVLQAQRLGQHLATRHPPIGTISHIFASDLQRAASTARAVADAQPSEAHSPVVELPELRERDFGSSEGKQFGAKAKAASSTSTVREDAETYSQMEQRIARFIDIHLAPILESSDQGQSSTSDSCVVVVSHGILLNVLLWALMSKYAPGDLRRYTGGTGRRDYMTVWSNTGYTEALLHRHAGEEASPASPRRPTIGAQNPKFGMAIVVLNETVHLQGLKRTRGGIGSAKFDSQQKRIDSFFAPPAKRTKTTEEEKKVTK